MAKTLDSVLKYIIDDVVAKTGGNVGLTDYDVALDLLTVDIDKGKTERRSSRFPMTSGIMSFLKNVISFLEKCVLHFIKGLYKQLLGNELNLDKCFSRFNIVIYFLGTVLSLVTVIITVLFLYKDVLFFRPQNTTTNHGAICIPQSCGRENYMYLLNTAKGWSNTGIKVLEGDEIEVTASGAFICNVADMKQCAEDNCVLPKQRHPINVMHPDMVNVDVTNLTFQNNPHFGALLMQIKDDYEPCRYNDSNIIQLCTSEKRLRIKSPGILNFAVNDEYGVYKYGEYESVTTVCPYNVGDVLVTVYVKRHHIKGFPQCIMAKPYRSMETFFTSHKWICAVAILVGWFLIDFQIGRWRRRKTKTKQGDNEST